MKDFSSKLGVITGAGTGMGRELARQLIKDGCDLAICDFMAENMAETMRLCEEIAPSGTKITAHECDVADESQVLAFQSDMKQQHETDHIDLLFNNAGGGGAGSFILDDPKDWDRTFAVNWFGVYYCTRAFMPLLLKSKEGYIVNTSSVNGFWACLGHDVPHTAYSSAKFAVKGFTEGLQVDLRINAPHVKAILVMPGHIGTPISINARKILGKPEPEDMSDEDCRILRERMAKRGLPVAHLTDDEMRKMIRQRGEEFRDNAPLSPAQAAAIILDGVRRDQWRVLVGDDAHRLDRMVRAHPEITYDAAFAELMEKERLKDGVF